MSQPFARAIAMFALISQAMATPNPAFHLANIPAYVSRGKGRGRRSASRHCVAHDRRAAAKARNQQRHRSACK